MKKRYAVCILGLVFALVGCKKKIDWSKTWPSHKFKKGVLKREGDKFLVSYTMRKLPPKVTFQVNGKPHTTDSSGKVQVLLDFGRLIKKESITQIYKKGMKLEATYVESRKWTKGFPMLDFIYKITQGNTTLLGKPSGKFSAEESTMIYWQQLNEKNEEGFRYFNQFKGSAAKLDDIRFVVTVEESRGTDKTCYYSSKFRGNNWKIAIFDATFRVYDRKGKKIAERKFINRKCPMYASKYTKTSHMRTDNDIWKSWLRRVVRTHGM